MKRFNCALSDKRGAFGLCMEEHKEGDFVHISEVSGLADTVMKMGSRCTLLADLLREATKMVPAIGVAIDDLPVVDAFLERIEKALVGQALGHSSNDALAMMMDELHDICVGLDAPGGAQNGAETWDQVKGARDRVLASLHHGRPDTEWTDATTSPVAADYRELQEQHDQLQSTHKGALDLIERMVSYMDMAGDEPEKDSYNPIKAWMYDAITTMAGQRPKQSVAVTETIRTAPERIWLQIGDQSHYHSEPFPSDTSEVSWCADSVVGCEVPYVRADLAATTPEQAKSEKRTVTISGKGLLELVDFTCPDHETDLEQQETEIVLLNREAFISTDGEKMPSGVYAYLAEYPEEGLYGPVGGADPQGGAPCDSASPSSSPA